MLDLQLLKERTESQFKQMQYEFTTEENTDNDDPRFWKSTCDDTDKSVSTIRFLPGGEDYPPFVRMYYHYFYGLTGKLYYENSLTTINQKDPVAILNRYLWNSGIQKQKDRVSRQRRKSIYYSNILVIDDKLNPENNDQVFVFAYGKQVFEKIKSQLSPDFYGNPPTNIFDYWQGKNFNLIIKKKDGFNNYEDSKFLSKSVLGEEDKINYLENNKYDLNNFISIDNFKTFDELNAKLKTVLGISSPKPQSVFGEDTNIDNDVLEILNT